MLQDYKKYYYGRTDMTMLNDEKVYGSLGINLKKVTTIVEGVGSLILPNSLKAPLERLELTGNSVQGENPSPDNPQEIKSAGRKSRNLFDITKYDKYDDTWTNTTYTTKKLKLKPNTTYTMSCKRLVDKPKQYVFFLVEEGIASGRGIYVQVAPDLSVNYFISKGTFTTNDTGEITLSYYVDCPKEQYWFTEVIGDIQIEEGGKETAYEPYSDKYLFDVKVTGKNIFNKNAAKQGYEFGSATSDVETVKQGWFVSDFMPVKAMTYYISGKTTGSGCKLYNKDKVFVKNTQVPYGGIKFDEGIAYFRINGEIKDLDKIQVEEGTVATPYEPCTEQTVQIALNEPLRGIGECKDMLTKDGVVRRILEAPIVKYLKPVINGNVGDRYVFAEVPNANINYDRKRYMSNVGFTNITEKKKYMPQPYQLNFLIRVADDDTIEIVKEKIKDIIVAYTAKEPITEPLPESVQAQLQALHSENGVTHVFVDSGEVPCGINVEYVIGG